MPIRSLAVNLTNSGFWDGAGLQQKDFVGEARRILEFCRDQIRYVKDIDDVETLHDPVTLLKMGAGDCDDKSVLCASLLCSIGHTMRFIAVSFEPDTYSHVWVQDLLNGVWVDLEPTEPIPFGQSIPTRDVIASLIQDV